MLRINSRLPSVSRVRLAILALVVLLHPAVGLAQTPCEVTDVGGTVELPPMGCEYLSPDEVHEITDGLPPGTTIELAPIHKNFICGYGGMCTIALPPLECEGVGGALGGNADCFDSDLQLVITGTGTLAGFNRNITVPIQSEVHTGPRTPGDPVQTFATDMYLLQGEIFGDPDFCTFRFQGGTAFGLPSPGQTTLTKLSSGDFNVDSFFDIGYSIEFVGCPGSALEGFAGTTRSSLRMQTGVSLGSVPSIGAGGLVSLGLLLLGTVTLLGVRRRRSAT